MNEKDKIDIEQFIKQDTTNNIEYTTYHVSKFKTWITNDNSILDSACAKMVKYSSGNVLYFVKREGCSFFDPMHPSNIYKRKFWKMGTVSRVAFELYLEFLGFGNEKSKGHTYFKLKAERQV